MCELYNHLTQKTKVGGRYDTAKVVAGKHIKFLD